MTKDRLNTSGYARLFEKRHVLINQIDLFGEIIENVLNDVLLRP